MKTLLFVAFVPPESSWAVLGLPAVTTHQEIPCLLHLLHCTQYQKMLPFLMADGLRLLFKACGKCVDHEAYLTGRAWSSMNYHCLKVLWLDSDNFLCCAVQASGQRAVRCIRQAGKSAAVQRDQLRGDCAAAASQLHALGHL